MKEGLHLVRGGHRPIGDAEQLPGVIESAGDG